MINEKFILDNNEIRAYYNGTKKFKENIEYFTTATVILEFWAQDGEYGSLLLKFVRENNIKLYSPLHQSGIDHSLISSFYNTELEKAENSNYFENFLKDHRELARKSKQNFESDILELVLEEFKLFCHNIYRSQQLKKKNANLRDVCTGKSPFPLEPKKLGSVNVEGKKIILDHYKNKAIPGKKPKKNIDLEIKLKKIMEEVGSEYTFLLENIRKFMAKEREYIEELLMYQSFSLLREMTEKDYLPPNPDYLLSTYKYFRYFQLLFYKYFIGQGSISINDFIDASIIANPDKQMKIKTNDSTIITFLKKVTEEETKYVNNVLYDIALKKILASKI